MTSLLHLKMELLCFKIAPRTMHVASHPPSVRSPGAHQMLAGLVFQRHGGLTEPLNTKKHPFSWQHMHLHSKNLSFPSEQMWPGAHFVPVGLDLPPKSHLLPPLVLTK